MKTVVWTKYGGPEGLKVKEVEKPIPKDNEILIKIHATTAMAGDCEIRRLEFPFYLQIPLRFYFGLFKPKRVKILGQELAGEVVEVGKNVSQFKKGDKVFAALGFGFGAYAEYISLPEQRDDEVIAPKPTNMSYEEAAVMLVGGLNALHFLHQVDIQKGQKILINGAGGSIGTVAIQLAKSFGAEVTAVDSTTKLEMLRAIGADQVIDYTQEDFTKSDEKYDIIFDVVGKAPFRRSIQSLTKKGVYLLGNPALLRSIRGRWVSMTTSKKIVGGTASYNLDDLLKLKELIEAGKIKAVIDKRFPLEKTAEAHEYIENGHKKGNVVITVVKEK
ncbi:MAG: zinc-binding dehydrogenase [Candidatus Heimdallarchaeota archaeon]|nr:zinc-binding dehydrogenase [Candidatus Heimdallarchaeota archaeon]